MSFKDSLNCFLFSHNEVNPFSQNEVNNIIHTDDGYLQNEVNLFSQNEVNDRIHTDDGYFQNEVNDNIHTDDGYSSTSIEMKDKSDDDTYSSDELCPLINGVIDDDIEIKDNTRQQEFDIPSVPTPPPIETKPLPPLPNIPKLTFKLTNKTKQKQKKYGFFYS